jgi:hypothetical protein
MTSINNVVDTEKFNDIKLEEQNIKILSQEDKDYLLIDLKNNIDSLIEKYYLFDEEGNSFILEGILVYDSSIYYDVLNDTNIFYSDDKQILGKILKNDIYALEYQSDKTNALVEYRYYIKDGTLKREKLNTFKCEIIEEDEEK